MAERRQREPAPDPRTHQGKGFTPLVSVTQRLHDFTSGGVSLADAKRLNEDESFKVFLGVEKLPDQSTLGEGLRDMGEPGWQALRRISRDFVQWALARAEPGRSPHLGRTEGFFDDTQIGVSGPSFEGTRINSEGKRALSRQLKACLYAPTGWVAWWRGLLGERLPRCRVWSGVGAVDSGWRRRFGRRFSPRGVPRSEAEVVVCLGGVVWGVGSRH